MENLPHASEEKNVVTKTEVFCYVNGNGHVVFDKHESDALHVASPATRETQPLYDCRTYLRDLIPQEWIDKRGTLKVSRYVTTKKTVVSITFVPDQT